MNDLIQKGTYDLPVKTLQLAPTVIKTLTAAPTPEKILARTDNTRADRYRFSTLAFGKGVREGVEFRVPSVSYQEFYTWFDGVPEKAFSAKTAWFGYRMEHGRFLSLEAVVNRLYSEKMLNLKSLEQEMPESVVTVTSGGAITRIRAAALLSGRRFFYPQLTSEQILSGMKPADTRGEMVEAGFLRTGEAPEDYEIIFVIGQRNWNDINEPCFLNFADGGASVNIEYLPEARKAHNILYVGPMGGSLGEDVVGYPGAGAETVELTARGGSLIRFNLDNDNLLNEAKMYYYFGLDNTDAKDPRPEDGYAYNSRIPLYFGGGADYNTGIILPQASEHNVMTIKMMSFGPECPDTVVDHFTIHII